MRGLAGHEGYSQPFNRCLKGTCRGLATLVWKLSAERKRPVETRAQAARARNLWVVTNVSEGTWVGIRASLVGSQTHPVEVPGFARNNLDTSSSEKGCKNALTARVVHMLSTHDLGAFRAVLWRRRVSLHGAGVRASGMPQLGPSRAQPEEEAVRILHDRRLAFQGKTAHDHLSGFRAQVLAEPTAAGEPHDRTRDRDWIGPDDKAACSLGNDLRQSPSLGHYAGFSKRHGFEECRAAAAVSRSEKQLGVQSVYRGNVRVSAESGGQYGAVRHVQRLAGSENGGLHRRRVPDEHNSQLVNLLGRSCQCVEERVACAAGFRCRTNPKNEVTIRQTKP